MKHKLLTASMLLMFQGGMGGGCSGADVKVEEASAPEHKLQAQKEREKAAAEKAKYDPSADRQEQVGAGTAGRYGDGPILVTVNPTDAHLAAAESHRRHAQAHEKAAQQLMAFEDIACKGVPNDDRLSCPTLLTDSLSTLKNGVRMHTGPKRLSAVLANIQCHLAFAKVNGYNNAYLCPFAIKGVSARPTADGTGIELISEDPTAVKTLHDLIFLPLHVANNAQGV